MTQLGDTLSDERRRQGRSLVDVESATRIRGRLLEALEHGDYDQLPAPAYVKGYIQSYAKYLDIPVQPLLEMYKVDVRFADERESERDRLPLMPRGARYSKASRQDLADLPAEPVVPKSGQQHAIPTRTWMIAAAGIVGVFVVIFLISKLLAGGSTTPPPLPTNTTVQETSASTSPEPSNAASVSAVASTAVTPTQPDTTTSDAGAVPSADSTAGITPFKLTFRIHAGQTSQLKVTVDGSIQFNDVVSKSADIPSFSVYRKVVIVIAKPRWVTTMKDGKRVPTPNQDTDYTLTLNNDKAPQ
jgi:cytoskeleton protein RodZ